MARCGGIECRAGIRRDGVRNDHLLEEPDREDRDAGSELIPLRSAGELVRELRHHFLVVQHRPRDQVGEVGDEKTVVNEVGLLHFASLRIHQEGNLREGEKGNADGQDDLLDLPRVTQQGPCTRHEEVGVLVVAQQQQVARDSEANEPFRFQIQPRGGIPAEVDADDVVESDRAQQQRHAGHIPHAVEHQRRTEQPCSGGGGVAPPDQKKTAKSDREEEKKKGVGVEQHVASSELMECRVAWPGRAWTCADGAGIYRLRAAANSKVLKRCAEGTKGTASGLDRTIHSTSMSLGEGGWRYFFTRASISSVFALRSAFTFCTVARSPTVFRYSRTGRPAM